MVKVETITDNMDKLFENEVVCKVFDMLKIDREEIKTKINSVTEKIKNSNVESLEGVGDLVNGFLDENGYTNSPIGSIIKKYMNNVIRQIVSDGKIDLNTANLKKMGIDDELENEIKELLKDPTIDTSEIEEAINKFLHDDDE